MTATRLTCISLLFCSLILSAVPVSAHHASRAVYDTMSVTMMGTVTNYEWSNPHIIVSFQVKDAQGKPQQWHAEVLPPSQASAAGWTRNSLKPGDAVTVVGYPGRNAQRIMLLEELVTADGKTLSRR